MFDIELIKKLIKNESFYLSQHALKRTFEREITIDEITEILENAEIIEQYPDDKY